MAARGWAATAVYVALLFPAARLCSYYSGPAALGTVLAMGLTPAAVMVTFFASPRTRTVVVGASLVVTAGAIIVTYVDVFHSPQQ